MKKNIFLLAVIIPAMLTSCFWKTENTANTSVPAKKNITVDVPLSNTGFSQDVAKVVEQSFQEALNGGENSGATQPDIMKQEAVSGATQTTTSSGTQQTNTLSWNSGSEMKK